MGAGISLLFSQVMYKYRELVFSSEHEYLSTLIKLILFKSDETLNSRRSDPQDV
jgi:hypothetical protein